jgi:glycerophosphoryl diester phosphodiesterase
LEPISLRNRIFAIRVKPVRASWWEALILTAGRMGLNVKWGTGLLPALFLVLVSCKNMDDAVLVIGHRGAMGYETENTIASVRKALDLGVDMIEIDVFRIESGEIVVFHDERVERLTNGGGNVEEYNWLDLLQLTLDGNHKIPQLQEVLREVNHQARLNIELKGSNTADRVNFIVTTYIKNQGWLLEDFIISSFKWEELQEIRRLNPEIPIAILTEGDPVEALPIANELEAEAINPHFRSLTRDKVTAIQQAGFRVYTWTVNEPVDIKEVKAMGVDGIITNFPDRVR